MKMPYVIYNATDGIMASPELFMRREDAETFVKEFPKRFGFQGYYLTSNQERIPADKVVLEIGEVE